MSEDDEAVSICRRLAATRPCDFEPNLALSLNNLSELLLPFDRRAGAIAAAEEGIALLTAHHARHPDAHQETMDELAATLANARAVEAGTEKAP
tara:strand:- start:3136 stop:3417 length:282 start_codon:yes stop_codon:yes gene_type:complete